MPAHNTHRQDRQGSDVLVGTDTCSLVADYERMVASSKVGIVQGQQAKPRRELVATSSKLEGCSSETQNMTTSGVQQHISFVKNVKWVCLVPTVCRHQPVGQDEGV